ncbi:MAG: VTT domain-containing protein [Peptococcaceae bacterium]|nr:VTT domain-containing protein [Peptococcaceae bacterium]
MLWWSKIKKHLTLGSNASDKALRRRKLEKYMPVILFLLAVTLFTVAVIAILVVKVGMPLYDMMTQPNAARDWILSFGKWSYLFFVGIVFLQVVVAILPGEPFQIGAGLAFGPVMGSILSLLGILLGSITTFMLTRIFGYKLIELLFSERTRSKLDLRGYSHDSIERVVIIAFLIPGTPKDFLAYAAGLTPITLKDWIRITCMTRIAPIVMACLTGQAINNGDMKSAATLVIIGNIINLGVYLIYELHHRWQRRHTA